MAEYLVGKITPLDNVEIPNYDKLARQAKKKGNFRRARALDSVRRWCEMKSDSLKVELGQPVTHDVSMNVVREEIENNEQVT